MQAIQHVPLFKEGDCSNTCFESRYSGTALLHPSDKGALTLSGDVDKGGLQGQFSLTYTSPLKCQALAVSAMAHTAPNCLGKTT